MPLDFTTTPFCGACGGALWVFGLMSHELYPALAAVSMLCSAILGVAGVYQLVSKWLKQKREK